MKGDLAFVYRNVKFRVCASCSNTRIAKNMSNIASLVIKEGEIKRNVDKCLLHPPTNIRGMNVLDRRKFLKTITIPWLVIGEMRLGPVLKHLKKYLLKVQNFKPVQVVERDSQIYTTDTGDCVTTKIALNPTLVSCYDDLEEGDRVILQNFCISKDSLRFERMDLTYDNWRADELLKAILPVDKDSLTSYSIIGHIVHVNLRDHLLGYKKVIGEILLDKIKGARTIVNKTNSIENTYRNFKMEIICGDKDMFVQVRENHCTFEFDFSSVYWNPRLCTEHERVVSKVKQGDVLYDVFAGVGPFSIPAAKKKCIVFANDLNPESHKWLIHNGKINKVNMLLHTFNKDGKAFIKEDIRRDMLKRCQNKNLEGNALHITMNLPAMAVTFLKTFRELFNSEELESLDMKIFPIVYLYCFVKGDDPKVIAQEMVEENLGLKLKEDLIEVSHVRNVSVKKEMMRVTFRLSKTILIKEQKEYNKISRKHVQDLPDEAQVKRLRVGNNGESHQIQT